MGWNGRRAITAQWEEWWARFRTTRIWRERERERDRRADQTRSHPRHTWLHASETHTRTQTYTYTHTRSHTGPHTVSEAEPCCLSAFRICWAETFWKTKSVFVVVVVICYCLFHRMFSLIGSFCLVLSSQTLDQTAHCDSSSRGLSVVKLLFLPDLKKKGSRDVGVGGGSRKWQSTFSSPNYSNSRYAADVQHSSTLFWTITRLAYLCLITS